MNIILVHGFKGRPESDWLPWVRQYAEAHGDVVDSPAMPTPAFPRKQAWVDELRSVVQDPSETVLVGYSLGCAAILSMLQEHTGAAFAHVILVAGFGRDFLTEGKILPHLTGWFASPLDFSLIREKAKRWTSISSTDDPLVPREESEWLAEQLGSHIVIEEGKKHFRRRDGVTELPSVVSMLYPTDPK